MRIQPVFYAAFVLIIFLGTIFGFQAAGVWSISGKITSSGEAVQPLADDVDTIKGWMTLEQIATAYNVPLEDIILQFNLPADTPASTAIKDLESDEFSVTNLRTWLLDQTSLAQVEVATVPATPTAVVSNTVAPAISSQPTATQSATEHTPTDKTVTGKTTIKDLIDWGVPVEVIQRIIGDELPASSTIIKNFITAKGLEFSPVKTALQAEVDKTK